MQEKLRMDKVTFRCVSVCSVTMLFLCCSSFSLREAAESLLRPNPRPHLFVGNPSLPPAKRDLLWCVLDVLFGVTADTSCITHPHSAFPAEERPAIRLTNMDFQICFYLGWQINAGLPVVVPSPELLSLHCMLN